MTCIVEMTNRVGDVDRNSRQIQTGAIPAAQPRSLSDFRGLFGVR